MRARRPARLEEKLASVAAAVVEQPCDHAGSWAEDFLPGAREVRLDLGCGKGQFLVAAAQAEPDVLFVGVDNSEICVWNSGRKVLEDGVPNAVVVHAEASLLPEMFATGELNRIYLNFNTPFPKKKHAFKRLTHIDYLAVYRELLAKGGFLDLRTDNWPYWMWTLEELKIANYGLTRCTQDLHAFPIDPNAVLTSEYDRRTRAKGAQVYALWAEPGPAPEHMEQTAEPSLTAYLPEDLSTLEHIPYGMEETVFNWRNRAANAAARAERHAKGEKA